MSFLTDGDVDEKMHSKVAIVGSRPAGVTAAIHLAQPNLDSVLSEDFMGNGFTAGGQRTATVNGTRKFPGLPTRIRGPESMNKFCEQSLRFGTHIEDEETETADTVIVATSASVKRVGLRGEEAFFAERDENEPLAVIGGCYSAVEEATRMSHLMKYGFRTYVHVLTILWNTEATECQGDGELLKNLRIRDIQTGFGERSSREWGCFMLSVTNPQRRSFRTQLQTDPDGYVVNVPGSTWTSARGIFAAGVVQAHKSAARSGCMAALEVERLIAEEEEKEMVGE
ncbi:FAD/NAD(P)-binding domain-containing protein [Dendrothele bispora CBS 962.96]|uniref:FAD/NAD(P)-binding domain-containing protein n=1 Tax=Dendrothele bispora (strain CBS 962.96) TaxID=1314807 RepID=A0A4S8LVV4_DENBC|nr:FAD/NAD(P)-binding domain-containing protein [Dendrothele bispora CBS 962.96]